MSTPPSWTPDPVDDRWPAPPPPSDLEPPAAPEPGAQYAGQLYGANQYGAPQYGANQYGAPQYNAPQYGAPQYNGQPAADPYRAPAPGTDPGPTPYAPAAYAYAEGGYAYGPGNTYASQRTSGMAIASLVVSLSSFLLSITAPVGLILGIVALNGIKRDGAKGRGLAIAGIAVGAVMTLVMVVSFIFLFVLFAGIAATPGGFS